MKIVPLIVKEMKLKASRTGRKFRLKKPIKPASIKPIERRYLRSLDPLTAAMKAAVEQYLLTILPSILRQAENDRPKGDSARADGYSEDIDGAMDRAKVSFFKEYTDAQIANIVSRQGSVINSYNAENFRKNFKSVLGIDARNFEPWLDTKMQDFVKLNVSLIKTIPSQYFDRVEQTVLMGVQQGKLIGDLTAEINKIYDIGNNRAELIARDQTGKFNGQLNELRQVDVGVSKYIWSTSLDERVRPEHAEREGEVFAWNDPPEDGAPGIAINCRCVPLAVFDDVQEPEN